MTIELAVKPGPIAKDVPGAKEAKRPPITFRTEGLKLVIINTASWPPESIVAAVKAAAAKETLTLPGLLPYDRKSEFLSRAIFQATSDKAKPKSITVDFSQVPDDIRVGTSFEMHRVRDFRAEEERSKHIQQTWLVLQQADPKKYQSDKKAVEQLKVADDSAVAEAKVKSLQKLCKDEAAASKDAAASSIRSLPESGLYDDATRSATTWLMDRLGLSYRDFLNYRLLAPGTDLVDYLSKKVEAARPSRVAN